MKDAGKMVFKGVLFGLGLPIGVILAFHVFYLIGHGMLALGINP